MTLHPKYKDMIDHFKDIDLFKYAAYRMALKVQRFQKICKLHMIDLNTISNTLKDSEYNKTGNGVIISIKEAELFICALYNQSKCQCDFSGESRTVAQILLSFLSSTFCNKSEYLYLHQLKIVLTLFSAAKLIDKYRYLFQELSCGGCMNKEDVRLFLECVTKVAEVFGEKLSFGSGVVDASVQSYIQFNGGHEKVYEPRFLDWLFCEPQSLVWFSTHYRLSVAEKNVHNVKCNVCKVCSFYGLRYKCLCCFGYNLCQQCFLRGYVNQGHQSEHLVHEFCQPVTPWEEVKIILKIFRNKFVCAKKLKPNFLAFRNFSNFASMKESHHANSISHKIFSTSYEELWNIIEKLEEKTRLLGNEIRQMKLETTAVQWSNFGNTSSELKNWIKLRKDSLQNHHYCLQLEVHRLQQIVLKSRIPDSKRSDAPNQRMICQSPPLKFVECNGQFESTPLAAENQNPLLYVQRNLSNFIKLQAKLDGIINLSKSTTSQEPVLYSLGDIEIDENTECSSRFQNEQISERFAKKAYTNDKITLKSSHFDESPCDANDTFQGHMFCSLDSFASSKINTLHGNCLYLPYEQENAEKVRESISPLCSFKTFPAVVPKISLPCKDISSDYGSLSNDSSELKSQSLSSLIKSNFEISEAGKKSSIECIGIELQKIIDHLENVPPNIAGLQNISVENNKLTHALSEMEQALKKLSSIVADEENANRNC